MNRFVLDCSVSAAWCLRERGGTDADRWLAMLAEGEALVPPLWIAEMANVLLSAERRRRIQKEDVNRAIEILELLPITVVDPGQLALSRIHALAAKQGLSAFDACYLDLAVEQRVRIATLDDALRSAARSAGVRLA